jgi:hypothetical protein
MALVLDTLIIHELEFYIPSQVIQERHAEWIRTVLTVPSRAHHIRGLCRFGGMELRDYDSAMVLIDGKGGWRVQIHSKQWMLRQPK